MQPFINRALAKKYFTESFLLLIACAAALFAFSWFRVWIVGELDTARFKQIVDMLPEDWRKFSSVDFDWLVSYLGRTSLTLDEPMLLMVISIWAIVRGSDVVSGELGRGTMEMVLAQPVSRARIYFQHMLLTLGIALGLCLLVWAGMSIGIWTTSVEESTYPEFRVPLTNYKIPITFFGPQTETVTMMSRCLSTPVLSGYRQSVFICLFCLLPGSILFRLGSVPLANVGYFGRILFPQRDDPIVGHEFQDIWLGEICQLFWLLRTGTCDSVGRVRSGSSFSFRCC